MRGVTTRTTGIDAAELRDRLVLLLVERALADVEGLTANAAYAANLDADIVATRSAWVGAAVTEIATLRGLLSGRPQG